MQLSRLLLYAALVSGLTLAACRQRETAPLRAASRETAATPVQSPVERGRYLVETSGCDDCHTPMTVGPEGPAPDMTRRLSGHPESLTMPPPPELPAGSPWGYVGATTNTAFAGPWGVSYSANLTPDQNTGLGIWTEAMFVGAMRSGKHMATSRPILPPMPWRWYSKMTEEDLKAIYAFLTSVRPVVNHVPDPGIAEQR